MARRVRFRIGGLAWALLAMAALLLFFSGCTVVSAQPLAVLLLIALLIAASVVCAVANSAAAARDLDQLADALNMFLSDVRDDAVPDRLRERAEGLQRWLAEASGAEPRESPTHG